MEKRGQVTIFIIIAVLVVGAVALFFTLRGGVEKEEVYAPEVAPIQNYVQECLEETTLDSIYFNSLQGGYFSAPRNSMDVSFVSVPVYFYNNVSRIPLKEVLENELSKTIEDGILFCLDFESFEEQGYNVLTSGEPKVNVKMLEERVDVKMNYLVTLSKGDFSKQFKSFEKQVDFDYLGKYEVVKEFLQLQETDPEYVFLTELENLGAEKGFNSKLVAIQDTGDYFYNFIYPAEINKEQTYMYSFVVKY